MAIEQFKNDAATTLDGAINNSVTSITVSSATGFPSSPQFRIAIESEIMLVTAMSGVNWTVARGQESTTAASHADTLAVVHVLTAGALDKRRADDHGYDSVSSRPAGGAPGRLFIPQDGLSLMRDDGSNFIPFGVMYKFKQPLAVAGFTWVNQGGSTAVDQGGLIYLTAPLTSGNAQRILEINAPGTPYTITAAFKALADISNGRTMVGLVWRESGSGKTHNVSIEFSNSFGTNGLYVRCIKYDSNTSENSDYLKKLVWLNVDTFWFRITDDGTNRTTYMSSDGVNFTQIHQVGRTDFITADQVGFFIDAKDTNSNIFATQAHLLSWEQT